MAVSLIEEKILGRLAKLVEPSNPFLSASLYQVLGLSILLSRKLYRARKLRKLDGTRDTKSLQLYHHIIWLAREGLSVTEVYILPNCHDGEHGRELKVMAAKLRASLYHVFCLFHNHPPISQINSRSPKSGDSPPSSGRTAKSARSTRRGAQEASPMNGKDSSDGRRRPKASLRDAIPSMVSEASYITNPYASGQTPPPGLFTSADARRTPTRPPGLAPIDISPTHAAASYLLPPLNFVPMAREHFEAAQGFADRLLPSTHALRLSITLEHSAFLWDCAKEHERARALSRRAIKEVYSSSDGLDDDEFADASALVQALGAIVKRGSNESTPVRPENQPVSTRPPSTARVQRKAVPRTLPPLPAIPQSPPQQRPPRPTIDRTIPVSPPSSKRNGSRTSTRSPQQFPQHPSNRTLDRLSTVPEVGESTDDGARSIHHPTFSPPTSQQGTISPPTSRQPTVSPPKSRPNSRASRREREKERRSSTASASDKATKRKIVERAEQDLERRQSQSTATSGRGRHKSDSPEQSRHSSNRSGKAPQSDLDRPRRSSRNNSGSGSSGSRRDRDGSGANGEGGSQPHSRQVTPTEGLDSFPLPPNAPSSRTSPRSSSTVKETKRARKKKKSRKGSAAGSTQSREGSEARTSGTRPGSEALGSKKPSPQPSAKEEYFTPPPQRPTASSARHASSPSEPRISPPPHPHHNPPPNSSPRQPQPTTPPRTTTIPRKPLSQSTPSKRTTPPPPPPTRTSSNDPPVRHSSSSATTHPSDRRDAILRALQILSAKVSRSLGAADSNGTTRPAQGTSGGPSSATRGGNGSLGVYKGSLTLAADRAARLEAQKNGGGWGGGTLAAGKWTKEGEDGMSETSNKSRVYNNAVHGESSGSNG
ncbi:hypothetical protein TI39_contig4210g00003 [Zymoseptoria brevis]|uniref:14-3-3 domain-containing protein n=1 Tax=Zymoseptoria brevis TaxID=1047168 RepID=A0A0F4GDB6_9PEZI|nr:hypothetical protein TI39_contig4210g00003 [Zymoseptoria brevis]